MSVARPPISIPISMWWLNAGFAPIYREYRLAVELHPVEICLLVPIVFVLGLLDPKTSQPAVLLAIKGPTA